MKYFIKIAAEDLEYPQSLYMHQTVPQTRKERFARALMGIGIPSAVLTGLFNLPGGRLESVLKTMLFAGTAGTGLGYLLGPKEVTKSIPVGYANPIMEKERI